MIQDPTVTQLLEEWNAGDPQAAIRVMPLVYDELRRIARGYFQRERRGHTLQATAVVHEAYVRLIEQSGIEWQSRAHFIGVAASVMRQVLIDYARKEHAAKRGGPERGLALDEGVVALSDQQSAELLDLDRTLEQLEKTNPKHSKIIEMRYFGGLTVEETGEALGVSPITVKRDWAVARAWLKSQIRGPDEPDAAG